MITLIDRNLIEEVAIKANVDINDDATRVDYQGPYPAFGVVLRDTEELARFMFFLALRGGERDRGGQLHALGDVVRVDSVGRDLIAYFPGFELEDTQP